MTWLVLAALAGLLVYCVVLYQPRTPVQPSGAGDPGTNRKSVAAKPAAAAVAEASRVLRLRPEAVLATVNGHPIALREAVPFTGTNQEFEISSQELKFFVNRAVDRELIFEAAKKQGVFLDNSQNQQLATMQSMRNQLEPDGLAKLNNDPAARQMEALDAQAFMLQTGLMAARGDSADVSESQVQDYYQQHESDYGTLPADPMARQQTWQQVAYQIRTQLAGPTRTQYNAALAAYMEQLKSGAEVVYNYSP